VQNFTGKVVVLNFLHQSEALGPAIFGHGEIHEQIFRNGMMDQVFDIAERDLKILRRTIASINNRRNAAIASYLFQTRPPDLRSGICCQRYRFHAKQILNTTNQLTGAPALKLKKRSHRRITVNSVDRFAQ
jgi:hypothetical protein